MTRSIFWAKYSWFKLSIFLLFELMPNQGIRTEFALLFTHS